jgi:hypothetical protein
MVKTGTLPMTVLLLVARQREPRAATAVGDHSGSVDDRGIDEFRWRATS